MCVCVFLFSSVFAAHVLEIVPEKCLYAICMNLITQHYWDISLYHTVEAYGCFYAHRLAVAMWIIFFPFHCEFW